MSGREARLPIVRVLLAAAVLHGCTLLLARTTSAAGFVHSPNFLIFTPPDPTPQAADGFAQGMLKRAEELRKQIAIEWLGEELPPSIGQVIVHVRFANQPDAGLTWAKDHPDRKLHALYLVTAPQQLPESLLAHELVHCVLATRFPSPNRLPAWLEEGIASGYDDGQRRAIRQQIGQYFVTTGHWPRLAGMLTSDKVHSDDQEAYTLCATLVELLLERGDRKTLLQFGQLVNQVGLDRALKQCYGIADASELESLWRAHVSAKSQAAKANLR
jgi:hypothetical protein